MRCFLVVGPESSGTRMMTTALINSGCREIGPAESSTMDDYQDELEEGKWPIVIHRSLPHDSVWPDLRQMRRHILRARYALVPIIMVRNWHAMVLSQMKRHFVSSWDQGIWQSRRAIQEATNQLPEFTLVTYEAWCHDEWFRDQLFAGFGLAPPNIDIWYGNEAYA